MSKKSILGMLVLVLTLCSLTFGYAIYSFKYLTFPTNHILRRVAPNTYKRLASSMVPEGANQISTKYALKGKKLVTELKKGGYVFYIRHAKKDDTPHRRALDLAYGVSEPRLMAPGTPKGLCLGKEGETESWLLGETIKSLQIPVGEVIASPICRCTQTASIAFGRVDRTDVNLVYRELVAELDGKLAKKNMKKLFVAPTREGQNRIIVAHKSLKIKDLGIHLAIGEPDVAIFKVEKGKAHLVSILKLMDWVKLLRRSPQ